MVPDAKQLIGLKKEVSAQSSNQVVMVPDAKQLVPKLVTSIVQILQSYPDVFEGMERMLSRSPILHPDRSKCYPQADTLQTNFSVFERSIPARI